MAGRKPISNKLKLLKGTYRKDRPLDEVEMDAGMPDCPRWVNASGKEYWAETAPMLAEKGLLSPCDLSTFSLHCDSFGLFIDVSERIESIDELITRTPQDFQVQDVLFQIRSKLWTQIIKTSALFGLSIQARAGIKVEKAPEQMTNAFDDI